MAAVCVMKCPHCNTEASSLVSIADAPINGMMCNVFMRCGACNRCVVLIVRKHNSSISSPHNIGDGSAFVKNYDILEIHPSYKSIGTPEYLNENIERYYNQAADNLLRNNYDAAGMMFRKVLDVATKSLGATKGKLQPRIDELAAKHAITPAMQEWAHAIRLDGNEAAHEEEPFDKETCEALKSFTELFLMYAFTLPGMLAERSAKKSS